MEKSYFGGKLTGKQKALGLLILIPAYLFYFPTLVNFFIKIFIDFSTTKISYSFINVCLNLFVGLATLLLALYILKDFVIEDIKIFKAKRAMMA